MNNLDIFWLKPWMTFMNDATAFAPKIVAAVLVLLAGLFFGWLVRSLAHLLFRWIKLDQKAGEIWLFRLWSRSTHGHLLSDSGANFFFYAVMYAAILLAVRFLGVGDTVLRALLDLVPRVFGFILILLLGALIAMFLSILTQLFLATTRLQHPNFWGKVIAWSVFGVTMIYSLEQLGLAGRFLTLAVFLVLGTAGLAGALAFGLGCKDLAREFLIELLKEEHGKNGTQE
ncbi:MAG: hypothetical protein AB1439_01130 [candidate division FCPU426 bacterium]